MNSFNNFKTILWDIDGTIFSAEHIIADAYKNAFLEFQNSNKVKLNIPTTTAILPLVGRPVKEIFKNLVPDLSDKQREELSIISLNKLVVLINEGKGYFYPKMKETMEYLHKVKNYKFFAASNGRYPYIEAILSKADIIDLFSGLDCIDNKKIHNKNDLVAYILSKYNLNKNEVVLVGDRKSDSDACKINNISFIALSHGHGEKFEWENPIYILDSFDEMTKIL